MLAKQKMTTLNRIEPTPKRIVFLSEDVPMIDAVSERLAIKGVETLGFADIDVLAGAMGVGSKFVLVLDTKSLPSDRNVGSLMDHVERLCAGRPILVCIAHCGEIHLRLQALRAGAEAFLTEPVAVDELARLLLELSGSRASRRYRVLVVGQEPVTTVFVIRALEGAGMKVRIAADAVRVLDVLEAFHPDLVLTDLHMPGADGIELTTLIREDPDLPDTPVVFLSSELDKDKQMDALRAGGSDFIVKPVQPERLVKVVWQTIRAFRGRKWRRRMRQEHRWTKVISRQSRFSGTVDSSFPESTELTTEDEGSGEISRPLSSEVPEAQPVSEMVEIIEGALRTDDLYLMHQPIMAFRGKRSEYYETTVRIKAPDGGYIRAFDFLPDARREGMMPSIDRWVMEHALGRLERERGARRRLRFFVHQALETLRAQDWLSWLRDRILAHDLIKQPPVLQFQLSDLSANRNLATVRFEELRRLAIRTCLVLHREDSQVRGLIKDLHISFVRVPLPVIASLDAKQMTDLVADIHKAGAKVIVAQIENSRTISRVFGCGVDYIQGNFLHPPSPDLHFDFGESPLP
jgi:CheY-like chemotaxis protein